MLRDKAFNRINDVRLVLAESDDFAHEGDWHGAAALAASARDSAEAARIDFEALAKSLEDDGYASCMYWYCLADEAAELHHAACAVIDDCIEYLR